MIRALARRLRALLALPGAVEAAVETAHLRAVVASQGASLLRRDAATAELMAERDDLRADVARLTAERDEARADRDIATQGYGACRGYLAASEARVTGLAADLARAEKACADAATITASSRRAADREVAFQRGLYEAELVVSGELQTERDAALTDLAAARAEAERLSAELRRLQG